MSFVFSSTPKAIWLYQYDADGAYVGSVFMHIPAHTGLPANTTSIPCEPDTGMTGVFKNEQWHYVDDIRGTQYWNEHGVGFVIFNLHDSLPDWAITVTPPIAEPGYVLLFREGQWQQIEDKTGQAFYESNGNKHIVPDAYYTIPEECTFIEPPNVKPTFVTRWNGVEWFYVKDLRGQVAYSTETKEQITITEIGPLADSYTLLVPGRFDEWDGKSWVKNEETERAFYADQAEQKKAKLLAAATEQIAVLTYAVNNNLATDSEKFKLSLWESYRLELNRVDTTTTDIIWPEKP